MKIRNIKSLLVGIILCLILNSVSAQQIIVNEFLRDGNFTTTNEFIEVVLMQDLTAAQLEGFFVGDSTGSTAAKFSGYQFTAMAALAPNFCAGTIITVTGDTGPAVDATYAPATGDWNLTFRTSEANLTGNGFGGNLASGDVAYVDTDGTNGTDTITADGFAVAWDSAPGAFANNASLIIPIPGNGSGATLDDDVANAAVVASWTSSVAFASLTPGVANGGANTTSIQALQAAALGAVTIADSPTMAEGNAGNTSYTFTVTRTASCVAATVDFAVTGTGANPADAADFGGVLPSGTANFAAGATTATITIDVSGDTDVEMDETFLVTISNPAGVALGATATDTGTITNDDVAPVVASAVVDNNVSINGGSDGQATASGSGGTAPYTFLWSDGQATATATGLVAGSYTVTVTDNGGVNNDTAMVTITEPTVLTATASSTDETSPGANDGTATVVAAGGVAPYTYLWMPGGATTATITGLMPGTYTVVVTDDNGATASPVAVIEVVASLPPAMIPTLNQYMIMLLMLLVGLVAVRRVKV
ncbi:MAG: SprB repeat-containing protein [Proteobacteria bacterium]|nr:SprB repeat-containing protein [Pseudomonadota bacterium]